MQQQNAIANGVRSAQGDFNLSIPDTRKIIRRHIQNKDDVITDDDLRSIQILQETSTANDSGFTTQVTQPGSPTAP